MKTPILLTRFGRAGLGLLFFFLVTLGPMHAQTFKPFTSLAVLKTDHFDIIFAEKSRPTALRLASFADEVYKEVTALLGIQLSGRIPVTITADTDQFNGYMNPLPYPHIVLFDTPMDIEWTAFQDPLRSLFLHELTHAVSLNSRGGIASFLHRLFGSWVNPTFLTAPLFMVEGVTVSFESLDGSGRASDPLVEQTIRQAVTENRALTPFQASGVYDYPPLRRSYYEYGGLFSSWLQKIYGMDRYSQLWQAMGSGIPLSLFYYNHGFYRLFKDTYGVPLKDAWQQFLASYATTAPEPLKERDILIRDLQIAGLAAADSVVYGIDTKEHVLFAVDLRKETNQAKKQRIRTVPSSAYDLSINQAQNRLLISYYRYAGDLASAVVGEYTTAGKATGREWTGIYKASYFRDGIVGIGSRLHYTDLVYVDGPGRRHVLAQGNDLVLFSKPVPIDDRRIAIILSVKGERRLGIFNVEDSTFSIVKTGLPDDAERWRFVRNLSARGTSLFFSYNDDHSFYRWGKLDLDNPNPERALYFSESKRSGGVLLPVQTTDSLVYRAAESTWDQLVRYPFNELEGASGIYSAYRLEPFDIQEGAEQMGTAVLPSAAQNKPKETAYNPIRYLNPLKFWLPVPLINNVDNSIRIDGMGIITYLMDPTDTNTVLINAGGDLVGKLGYFDISWTSLNLGFPVFSSVSDQMEAIESLSGYTAYRASRVQFSSPLVFNLGDKNFNLHLMPSLSMLLAAFDPGDGSSAYLWTYEKPLWAYGLSLGLSNFYRKPWQLFGNGAGLDLFARSVWKGNSNRLDATLKASKEPLSSWFALRGTIYGAWDERGMSLDGKSVSYGNAPFADVAASEYASQAPANLPWLAGGEAELKLFAIETQSNISHLYVNRLFGTLAYRGVIYEATEKSNLEDAGEALANRLYGYHSIIVKLGTVVSATPITLAPLRYSPFFWAAIKLSNLKDQDASNDFQLGFALSFEW
ncbi:hypothetical protein [Gracilinema caldarium]|uniref:hypothetical protein n=1 Tax=Gracilinema caldarium TaxID=215591 RepID=UPI0026EBE71A|nr:hypothetical protein [Gracilinema caldarium]